MPTFEFKTTWREYGADGVRDAQLGDLEQVSEREKAGVKALTNAALATLNLDAEHYDTEVTVRVEIEQDPPAITLSVA